MKVKKNNSKDSLDIVIKINRNTLLVIALVIVGLSLTYSYGKANGLASKSIASPSPASVIVTSPSPTPTTTPSPAVKYATPKPTPTPTPNPSIDPNKQIVRCEISPNCGGGFKEMTRETCQNTVCCQTNVYDKSSYTLRTKADCSSQQSSSIYTNCTNGCRTIYNKEVCSGWSDIDISKKIECELDQSTKQSECVNKCSVK